MEEVKNGEKLTLVTRKPCFGLPTACPTCLPVYIYLRFAQLPFDVEYNLIYPDSDQIPYVEFGSHVVYNNEKGGVIQSLKDEQTVDLDSDVSGIPEWVSTKAMVESWLAEAVMYELWVGSDGSSAQKIYYSDLPWPIGKCLYFKQIHMVKQLLGITKGNAERREEEETSVLRSKLLDHANLVRYAENLKAEFVDADSSSSSVSPSRSDPSSSMPKRGPSNWKSNPKSKPKREKTEEEKKFKRRAKYFLVTQLVAVLVFISLLGGSNDAEVEFEDGDDGLDYE
ncbi:mitochondrial outer membrane import complex protein METAXIN-like isoform X2 [Coffea arabica]|uniref:Mitochondrial outer membrane import complex protein METAXIN-like isoform X2 n=1 Tax=Coffea arabica TaxID=13443 RepID=A0ABM4UXF2_COFAR